MKRILRQISCWIAVLFLGFMLAAVTGCGDAEGDASSSGYSGTGDEEELIDESPETPTTETERPSP